MPSATPASSRPLAWRSTLTSCPPRPVAVAVALGCATNTPSVVPMTSTMYPPHLFPHLSPAASLAARQAGSADAFDQVALEEDKHREHWDQGQGGHGEDLAPVGHACRIGVRPQRDGD